MPEGFSVAAPVYLVVRISTPGTTPAACTLQNCREGRQRGSDVDSAAWAAVSIFTEEKIRLYQYVVARVAPVDY